MLAFWCFPCLVPKKQGEDDHGVLTMGVKEVRKSWGRKKEKY